MYNPEKSSKEKDGKRNTENVKKNRVMLYDMELRQNLSNKKLAPSGTPGKEKNTDIWISARFGVSENDRYNREILLEEKRKLTILIESFQLPFASKKADAANNLYKIPS